MSSNILSLFDHEKNVVTFAAGDTIFKEGDPGDKMYVIQEGVVDILLHGRLLESAQRGTLFGEMALIDNEPRSGDAIAKTDVRLIPLDQKRFMFMVQETPFFAIRVMHIMAQRLRAQHRQMDQ
jgi:CRP/FNR family cyclic AMP-dependent transcriptional regulator